MEEMVSLQPLLYIKRMCGVFIHPTARAESLELVNVREQIEQSDP